MNVTYLLTLLARICFHELLELVLLIDRLHVGFIEEVLLGASPSRHAAASTIPKSWRPWQQPGSVHAPKYQLWHMAGMGVEFSTDKEL